MDDAAGHLMVGSELDYQWGVGVPWVDPPRAGITEDLPGKAASPLAVFLRPLPRRMVSVMTNDNDAPINIDDFPCVCAKCGEKMRLFGIEWETDRVDIYTFLCDGCGNFEALRVEAH